MAISRKASTTGHTFVQLVVLCLALASCKVKGMGGRHPPRGGAPADPGTIFNVLQFGAKFGEKEISTEAFVKAWRAACDSPVKATVFVPPGVFTLSETVFQGPCKSPFPVTFQVKGIIKSVPDISEYTDKFWISFDTINGLLVTGGGTFDGQGPAVWKYNDCKGNSGCVHLPATLYFTDVQNAKLKGINLLNSMGFHMHITNSKVFRVKNLHITAPADSPNTDGMHISKSETVRVAKTVIQSGDDCISVGQGSINITINKVTCGPGHGISVGSLGKLPNELDVRGVIVKNCTLIGTTNGVRIKTWPGSDPSRAGGMLFSNIVMDNVLNPIIIDQYYGTKSTKPSLVKIRDVIYQDIKGTAASASAVRLSCSPQAPCENVNFRNINLKPIANNLRLISTCLHAKVGYAGFQFPPPCPPSA